MSSNFSKNYEHPKTIVMHPGMGVTKGATVYKESLTLDVESPTVPAGMFVSKSGDAERFLPRAKLTAPTDTAANAIAVDLTPVFKPGDELRVVEPYLEVDGTNFVAGEEYNLIVDRAKLRISLAGDLGISKNQYIVDAIAASLFSDLIYGIADDANDKIYFFSSDGITHRSLQLENLTAIGTFTVDGILNYAAEAIGIIAAFNQVDKSFILTTNNALALPEGTKVGVVISAILGLAIEAYSFLQKPFINVGLTTCNPLVYSENLPYLDGQIKKALSNLTFST